MNENATIGGFRSSVKNKLGSIAIYQLYATVLCEIVVCRSIFLLPDGAKVTANG